MQIATVSSPVSLCSLYLPAISARSPLTVSHHHHHKLAVRASRSVHLISTTPNRRQPGHHAERLRAGACHGAAAPRRRRRWRDGAPALPAAGAHGGAGQAADAAAGERDGGPEPVARPRRARRRRHRRRPRPRRRRRVRPRGAPADARRGRGVRAAFLQVFAREFEARGEGGGSGVTQLLPLRAEACCCLLRLIPGSDRPHATQPH